jgi:hypothetical protein
MQKISNVKKGFVLFLTFIFLISSLGVSLHFHHCKMTGHDISLNLEDTFCCGSAENPSNCCHNEVQEIKIKENYNYSVCKVPTDVPIIQLFSLEYRTVLMDFNPKSSSNLFASNLERQSLQRNSVSIPILFRSILI